jgi:uncharacterized protein
MATATTTTATGSSSGARLLWVYGGSPPDVGNEEDVIPIASSSSSSSVDSGGGLYAGSDADIQASEALRVVQKVAKGRFDVIPCVGVEGRGATWTEVREALESAGEKKAYDGIHFCGCCRDGKFYFAGEWISSRVLGQFLGSDRRLKLIVVDVDGGEKVLDELFVSNATCVIFVGTAGGQFVGKFYSHGNWSTSAEGAFCETVDMMDDEAMGCLCYVADVEKVGDVGKVGRLAGISISRKEAREKFVQYAHTTKVAEQLQDAFYTAADRGHKRVVEVLLKDGGVDVDGVSDDAATALWFTSSRGNLAVVEVLLAAGANENLALVHGDSALMGAAREGHLPVVEALLKAGALALAVDGNEESAISHAVSEGHLAVAEALVEAAGEALSAEKGREFLFVAAAAGGDAKAVAEVLAAGKVQNVDAVFGYRKSTAMMAAAGNGHAAVVEMLLAAGAKVDWRNSYQETPLRTAAENGHEAVVKLLMAAGAAIDSADILKQRPLMDAARKGNTAVVQMLLAAGAEVDAANESGRTALMHAAVGGRIETVKVLLAAGADERLISHNDQSAADLAQYMNHQDTCELLETVTENRHKKRQSLKSLCWIVARAKALEVDSIFPPRFVRDHDAVLAGDEWAQ